MAHLKYYIYVIDNIKSANYLYGIVFLKFYYVMLPAESPIFYSLKIIRYDHQIFVSRY